MRYFLYAYIILIPFLHALSPISIQSLGFFLLVAISPFVILSQGEKTGEFTRQDIFLFLTLAWGVVAWRFYPVPIGEDRIQGVAQWLSTIVFSLLILRKLIIVSQVNIEDIGKAASVSIIILSFALVADFYLANFSSERLSDIIPFSVDQFPKAEVLGTFQRTRGLTVEAGFNGIVYECLAPFSFYYFLKKKDIISYISIFFTVIGIFLIFSVLTLVSIASAITLLVLMKRRSFVWIFVIASAIPILIYFVLNNQILFNLFGYKIAEFFDFANYNVYGLGRQGSFFYGIRLFQENILGIGWGTVLQEASIAGTTIDYNLEGGSLISLWLELLVATGIVGFAFFSYVFVMNIRGLAEKRDTASDFIFISLAAVSLHHIFVYDLWFPMIWFSLAVAQVALSKKHGPAFLSLGRSMSR